VKPEVHFGQGGSSLMRRHTLPSPAVVRQQQVIGDIGDVQQEGVAQFVDHESACRDKKEAAAGDRQRVLLITKGQAIMSAK